MSRESVETTTVELAGMTCNHCVATVEKALLGVEGVRSASAALATQTAEVAFDPLATNLPAIRQAVKAVGFLPGPAGELQSIASSPAAEAPAVAAAPQQAEIHESTSIWLSIEGMTCASCVQSVEQAVLKTPGVETCEVSLAEASAHVTLDPARAITADLLRSVESAGYGATVDRDGPGRLRGEPSTSGLRRRLVVSAIFTIPLLALAMSHGRLGGDSGWVQLALALPVVLYGGSPFYSAAWNAARHLRSDMNTLIAVGTGSAFAYSLVATVMPEWVERRGSAPVYFETAAAILTLVLLGRMLEARARRKTSGAIRKLMELRPETVRVLRDGEETEIPATQLVIGDAVVVRAGERVPIDGKVIEGIGAIDESPLTGESLPADKLPGSEVLSGSLAKEGYLVVRAQSVGGETSLSRMIAFVRRAQNSKSPASRLADRIAAVFVPAILVLAALTFLAWLLLAPPDGRLRLAVNSAVSVLIIACPCALGLATPAALAVGIGRAAEHGILVRDGEALEAARDLDTVVFDKTGTLTLGNFEVTDIETYGRVARDDLLRVTCAIERRSEHPIAQAIAALDPSAEEAVSNFKTLPGAGASAESAGQEWLIGKPELLAGRGIATAEAQTRLDRSSEEGKTTVLVARGRALAGAFAVRDTLHHDAVDATSALRRRGIKTLMISGDSARVARATATLAGIDRVLAPVLPVDKAAAIERLQSDGERVAMVGDGINDAPALAQADLGIAIGAGSDIAVESADVILVRNSPADVDRAIDVARRTQRAIAQNYVWAFGYNLLGVPIAAGALYPWTGLLLSPVLASAAMALSSLSVLANSLRLGRALSTAR
ncbi:MAG: heavy metal translocating P-type ATPase [Bryobacterales bacterium]|nr:heavy metal translocating P-type ATPase [Bryobacterales bacterium]MDE0624316.1 heavy metal translocating P-type ATPase [Bryobacterales bacterium]